MMDQHTGPEAIRALVPTSAKQHGPLTLQVEVDATAAEEAQNGPQ